ncbi:MAG: peptidoglycan-associated lipoprotein Pal [Candidatus Eisenbacteria bacterium]|uniref:Peptidoglycan-associated lipoprotein Pal n=1 Tax=Eiseniibacteriota bacterium TaxID=2212470 RepID=A0A956M089_UNCEI|nr:peptidoglycan-associated lipoprotein Pal [Candidatus Eisenbacteria bacterium]
MDNTPSDTQKEPAPTPVQTNDSQEPTAMKLQDIFFDYDQFALRGDARRVLDANASVLKSDGSSVMLEGHCDERGTVEYNLALGEKRARSAKQYLVGLGVADSQMRTISYGEERPFAPGHDESAWSQNRRVHFQK